jgi:formylmethanofuran dehydrogenase subunit E
LGGSEHDANKRLWQSRRTFVDTLAGQAVRIVPRAQARELAYAFAPEARSKWEAQLLGYQRMPAEDLLSVQPVQLSTPIEPILGHAGRKAICESCGEEIMNGREIAREGQVLCKSCAGTSYYRFVADSTGLVTCMATPVETRIHSIA